MSRQASWAFDFNSIVKDPHMNVVCNCVISMKYCVCDYFVERLRRVCNLLKSLGRHDLNAADDFSCQSYSLLNDLDSRAFDTLGYANKAVPRPLRLMSLVAMYLHTRSFGQNSLRQIGE